MSGRTGGCLCGAVRYRLAGEPTSVGYCMCRDCQHMSSAGTVNAVFPSGAMEIDGETRAFSKRGDNGAEVERRFCPRCGVHLFADSSGRGALTVVRVGTLDEPSSVTPAGYIWTSSAPEWACYTPDLPTYETQP